MRGVRALRRPRGSTAICAALLPLLVVSMMLSVSIGAVHIPVDDVWSLLWRAVSGDPPASMREYRIVWDIRLPRTLLAATCGAGLGIVGVAVQTLVRNPLADPYVLGVSSGASVGAVAVLVFGVLGGLGMWALSTAAFVGALLAMAMVFALAGRGGGFTPLRLVLTGVAVAYVLSAMTSFLIFSGDDRSAASVLSWLLGSFGRARWDYVAAPAVVVAIGAIYIASRSRQMDALLLGEESASMLGVDVTRLRAGLFVVVALVTGVSVAVAGAVGFVGLVVPHLARLVVGAAHRRVVPVAALLGAIALTLADLGARTIVAPEELPVGVLTGLIGGPVFVWMMQRTRTFR